MTLSVIRIYYVITKHYNRSPGVFPQVTDYPQTAGSPQDPSGCGDPSGLVDVHGTLCRPQVPVEILGCELRTTQSPCS
jgi:hypothetical protein